MIGRTHILIAAFAVLAGLGLLCDQCQAQYATYLYVAPFGYDVGYVPQPPMHFHQVPIGTDCHWTPGLGWHGHPRYGYVPCPTPFYYRIPASSGSAVITRPY